MGRFFAWWLGLAPLAAVTSYVTAFVIFRYVDLSFAQFATLVTVPLGQAAVLTWRTERPAEALAALGWAAVRHPLAQPLLVLDTLVIGAGLFGWDAHLVGFGAQFNIHVSWTLVKVAVAAVFFAHAVVQTHRTNRTALTTVVAAPVLLILALEPSSSWMAATFSVWRDAVGVRGEVLQRVMFYGVLFFTMATLTLRSAHRIERQSPEAGRLFQIAIACAVVVALVAVLATFNLPALTQPWLGLAELFASCGASSVLLAALFLATAAKAPAQRGAP